MTGCVSSTAIKVVIDSDLQPATGEASRRIATAMKFELSTGEFVEITLADFNVITDEAVVIKREEPTPK
jgi:hypothetical protein